MDENVAPVSASSLLRWTQVPGRFLIHMVIGTLLFASVAVVAVLLHYFVEWIEFNELPKWMVTVLRYIEWGLFAADLLLYSIYFLRSVYLHAKGLLTEEIG